MIEAKAWANPDGTTSTVVLLLDDSEDTGKLMIRTNLGWALMEAHREAGQTVEDVAVQLAANYELTPTDPKRYIPDEEEVPDIDESTDG